MRRLGTILVLLLALGAVAFAQSPDDPQVQADQLFNEGNALLRAGNFAEAVKKYNEAILLVKDNRYYYQKAVALLRMQRFDDSIEAFNSAIQAGTNPVDVQLGLSGAYMGKGEELFNAGNYSGAIQNYRQAININPDPRYYNRLAIALRRDNRDQESVEAFNNAIYLDPDYTIAYVGLGSAHVSLERYDDAIAAYSKALELEPGMNQAKIGLATAYTARANRQLNQGQIRQAIETLDNAVEAHESHAQAYYLLAIAYNRIDQAGAAEENARKAIQYKTRGQRGGEYLELGTALRKQGKIAEARAAYQEAAKDPRYRRNAEYELEEIRRR
jgi:tetratricopeptide (TPR) repeat protein